jgi:hypothetical protein
MGVGTPRRIRRSHAALSLTADGGRDEAHVTDISTTEGGAWWRFAGGRRTRAVSCGPTTVVWREQAIAEIAGDEFALKWLTGNGRDGQRLDADAAREIEAKLETARQAAVDRGLSWRRRLSSSLRGASVERTWGQIDAAGEALLRVAPSAYVIGHIPRIRRRVERALRVDDPRRAGLESVARRYSDGTDRELSESERELLVTALHAANCEARRKQSRVRSFRNMLLMCGVVLTIAAVGFGALGYAREDLALLCFQPTGQAVCPTRVIATGHTATAATGQPASDQSPAAVAAQDRMTRGAASKVDVLLVELIGLIAAALAAAAALRRMHGTPTPYGVPFAVAVLKLPTGALTAALGLVLMRAEFVPGLSALDSPAQIIGWAVVFGYAQQLFTRFVDQRAQSVLDTAGAANTERRLSAAPAHT